MKIGKRIVTGALALCLAGMSLAGCTAPNADTGEGAAQTVPQQASQAPATVTVNDLEGTGVEVPSPENLDSIVITSFKGAYGAAVLLGQIDKVTGMPDNSKFVWLHHAFPQAAKIKDYGSFEEVNVEELLKDSPDAIISNSTSTTAIEKMRELDMPVLVDGIDIEDSNDVFVQSYDEIRLMANLTGTTAIADEYFAWSDEVFKLVKDRVKDIPDTDRVTVLPIRTDIAQVFGNNCIWGYVVEMAGGVNLAGESTAKTGKFFADVDAEQIAQWNPDMMFKINFDGEFTDEVASKAATWASDDRFKGMTAFENGDVYMVPKGIDYWNAAIESPLCVLWMAKTMYPDLFEDVDVKKEADGFYKKYLGYEMSAEDWNLMAPQFNGCNPNELSE